MQPIGAVEFRKRIESEGKLHATKRYLNGSVSTDKEADTALLLYVQHLLTARKYASAGVVLWGEEMFNIRPRSARDVWDAISRHPKVMVMGGGSVGKSYTGICWNLLNWEADPEYTTVKLISTTGGHAKSNTFSTIKMLHEKALVPLTGVVRSESIEFVEGDKRGCISIVRIRDGEDNSGVMQGFHPLPRSKEHPTLGKSSRVVAVLDEAEEIPNGAFTGIDNMLTSATSTGSHADNVKIMGFFNPKDISSPTARVCEPRGGWSNFDIETGVAGSNKWMSREGWMVVRIDPKNTENVVQKKTVFAGFQTYEGFKTLESKSGGNSLSYFTFGRGCYPPEGVICTVVSQRSLSSGVGEFTFVGKPIKIVTADTALDGRDDCVITEAEYGEAVGFTHFDKNEEGKTVKRFTKFQKPKDALQLCQQFVLPKGGTEQMAKSIRDTAIALSASPSNAMIDATGNGAAVLGILRAGSFWSPEVQGVDFGANATNMRILYEDPKPASDSYRRIDDEMWFALSRWLESGYLAISPRCASEELMRQLIGRRYKLSIGKLLEVEDKDIYKKRLGRSPDHADSAIIAVHRARVIATALGMPSFVEKTRAKQKKTGPMKVTEPAQEWID